MKKQKKRSKNKKGKTVNKTYYSKIKNIQDLYSSAPFRGEEEIKKKLDII